MSANQRSTLSSLSLYDRLHSRTLETRRRHLLDLGRNLAPWLLRLRRPSLAGDVWLGLITSMCRWKRTWGPCHVADEYADVEAWKVETGDDGFGEEVEDSELGQQQLWDGFHHRVVVFGRCGLWTLVVMLWVVVLEVDACRWFVDSIAILNREARCERSRSRVWRLEEVDIKVYVDACIAYC